MIKNAIINRPILIFTILFLILFSVLLILKTAKSPVSDNDMSRLGAVVAIARNKEMTIDNTIWSGTGDRVWFEGTYYSSKPPALSFILGITVRTIFQAKPVLLDNDLAIYRAATVLTTTVPLILIFLSFLYLLVLKDKRLNWFALISSIFLVSGTLLFTYSSHLTNHLWVVLIQLWVFALLILPFKRPIERWYYLSIGVLLGALFSLDVTYGFVAVPVTIGFLYIRDRKVLINNTLFLLLGFMVFGGLHFYLSYITLRTIFPPQMFPDTYLNYPGSKWVEGGIVGTYAVKHALVFRFINYTFGTYGLFLYQPFLIAVLFLKKIWKNQLWLYVFILTSLYVAFNAFMQTDYGGSAFGPRRFIPLIPLFAYFLYDYLKENWVNSKLIYKVLVIGVLVLNVAITFIGYTNPWTARDLYGAESERTLYFPLIYNAREIILRVF
jgi:hypothetical protein